MRQIALFTTDWNYELVGETLRGISNYLADHPDVNVRVFDCFGVDEGAITDLQQYEIYQLVGWGKYDGAIVQTHQIVMREEADRIEKTLRERGIPAVTLGIPLGDMPQVKSDDYQVFRHITHHLIHKHHVRKLWFVRGLESFDTGDQSEARQRRYGFTDACREAGIPEENLRYLDGNWQRKSGEQAARTILASEEWPEALVCANDDMALAAIGVLRKAGVRIPEDIRVTGFDGIFSSTLSSPRLATVDRNFQNVGYRAMETVMAMIEGKEVPRIIINETRDELTGTCGCRGNADAEIKRIKERFYAQSSFTREFYITQDKIANAFFTSQTLEDVMDAAERYADIFGGTDIQIYLDQRYYQSLRGEEDPEAEARMEEGHFSDMFILTADSRMRIAREKEHRRFDVGESQIRAEEGASVEERLIQYYPIRYGRIMAGVLLLRGLSAAAEMNLHESIINELALSLETIRQRQRLIRLNEKLNTLYTMDYLTGLHNRFGLEKYAIPLFDRLKAEGKNVSFQFLDVDDMKGINDRYGHGAGDEALKAAAETLRRVSGQEDYLMRYGGDEFVSFGPERDSEGARQADIDRIAAEICAERKIGFGLKLSIGRYTSPADSPEDLKSCMNSADIRMYEIKNEKKRG